MRIMRKRLKKKLYKPSILEQLHIAAAYKMRDVIKLDKVLNDIRKKFSAVGKAC